MAGPARRRLEMTGRIFRLAVRDLQPAAAAPEEEMPPPPRLRAPRTIDLGLAARVTAETGKKRGASVGGQDESCRKKQRRRSGLSADEFGEFKGKPTGAGERSFSSGDIGAGTSAGRPKSFEKEQLDREVYELREEPVEEENDEHAENTDLSPDAFQKAKNHIATVDLLTEMEEMYSLDIYRQRFAIDNGLPLPPPSWDRVPTPPIPSSPPISIIQISTWEEAKKAVTAWRNGCDMQLQVPEQLTLVVAEQILYIVQKAHAEGIILNLSVLEAKAFQTRFVRQKIIQCRAEMEKYSNMLSLPWLPTPMLPSHHLS